jgi:hypothetical protein
VDESEDQTRAVLRKIAARRNQAAPSGPPDLSHWHELFHWLKHHGEHRVYIPYAGHLADVAAASVVRMRRDFNVLLGMIEAHAVLHQASRKRDEHGRIIAAAADYHATRDIVAEAFAVSSGRKVKDGVRNAVEAVLALGGSDSDVTVAQVAKHLKRHRTRVTRGLKEAAELGYLTNREDKPGLPARYRTGPEPLPEDKAALPEALPDQDEGVRRTPPRRRTPIAAGQRGVCGCAPCAGGYRLHHLRRTARPRADRSRLHHARRGRAIMTGEPRPPRRTPAEDGARVQRYLAHPELGWPPPAVTKADGPPPGRPANPHRKASPMPTLKQVGDSIRRDLKTCQDAGELPGDEPGSGYGRVRYDCIISATATTVSTVTNESAHPARKTRGACRSCGASKDDCTV